MSVTHNKKTGKWDVRVTKDGVRKRHGSYDTKAIALAKEMTILYEKDVMEFEQSDRKLFTFKKPKWNRMPFKAFGNRGK